MMKLNKKDFELFKEDYKYFQNFFGLNHWKVYFKHIEYNEAFACSYGSDTYTATVCLPLEWDDSEGIKDKNKQIRATARHEALHLFTSNLHDAAYDRFASSKDITRAVEESQRLLEAFLDKEGYV